MDDAMSDVTSLRRELGRAVGAIDLIVAQLARAEHGDQRSDVAMARSALRAEASRLLLLRAQLSEQPMIPVTTEHLD